MQLSDENQAHLNNLIANNITIEDTPFHPEWGSSEHNIAVRNAMRHIAFNSNSSNNTFFNMYPDLTEHRDTFFAIAVEYGNQVVAESMRNEGASINGSDDEDYYYTPFAFALGSQNHSMIRWMLSFPDLDPNALIDEHDENGLSYAIEKRMPYDIIESMVDHGALEGYVVDGDELGNWYPLSMAVHMNDYRVIQLLLFHGADPQYEDDDEQVPADYASEDVVKNALENWSEQTTETLRQMVDNDPARLLENPSLWLDALETELNQGMVNLVMT